MATYTYGGAPYMAHLPQDSLRSLPEAKGGTKQTQNRIPPQPDIPAQYGLPSDYTYLNHRPGQPKDRYKEDSINRVVNHYLQAATMGGNPMEPQPNVMCECCMDINDESKRRKTGTLLDNGAEQSMINHKPVPGTKPTSPEVSSHVEPTMKKPLTRRRSKQVRFTHHSTAVGEEDEEAADASHYDIPFFRSEHDGPEMVVPQRYTGPDPDEDALQARTLFVTHPARKSLYSNWGVSHEIGTFGKERHMAEDVVEASSKYIDSMQRLKKIGQEAQY